MDPNVQQVPQPQPQTPPNIGQRNAMPPGAVSATTTPPASNANDTSTPMSSFSKEGGPIQVAREDEDEQQQLSQPLPITSPQDDEQPTVQQYVSPQTEREDATKTTQHVLSALEAKSETDQKQILSAVPVQEGKVGAEVLRSSTPEVALSQELAHLIEVTAQQERPSLTLEVQKAGVTYTNAAIPVPHNSFGMQTLPMQYQDAKYKEKTADIKDSIKWLAGKIAYFWRKIDPIIYK